MPPKYYVILVMEAPQTGLWKPAFRAGGKSMAMAAPGWPKLLDLCHQLLSFEAPICKIRKGVLILASGAVDPACFRKLEPQSQASQAETCSSWRRA